MIVEVLSILYYLYMVLKGAIYFALMFIKADATAENIDLFFMWVMFILGCIAFLLIPIFISNTGVFLLIAFIILCIQDLLLFGSRLT